MLNYLQQPWPWYVAGPLIGLVVPALLIFGNKSFGISSTLRDICAACIPAKIPFFDYNWKEEAWNLFFVAGIVLGACFAVAFLGGGRDVNISGQTTQALREAGLSDFKGLLPEQIFSITGLFTFRGFIFMVLGGFFVGFGTRYAGGCTSGHAITGLSTLQWPSLVATCCFMIGGFAMTWLVIPFILN